MAELLPIYDIEQDIVQRLKASRRLILQAPTGSGKSTQIAQILLKHGFLEQGQAILLQPRRIAARLLAARVAEELHCPLGQEIGYQIRFEHVAGPKTKAKFVTEGILLRQMLNDPALRGVQALIFDEFHERHLYGDITLARALELQETTRPDLLVVVMSATLETALLESYLRPCSVLTSQGRTFPVDIDYMAEPTWANPTPVWDLAAETLARYLRAGGPPDVLIFMPGSYEIQQTMEALRQRPEIRDFLLLPLHGELSPRDQDAAVARHRQPKVVVATNVAETSLTINGIRLVIDSGLARIPRFDPHRGINTLLVENISRAAADQRAGRAGRTAPGSCLRLWSKSEQGDRPAQELPEIKRLDLAEVILSLKAAGVEDLRQFRWLEAPDEKGLQNAEVLLSDLGALDAAGGITELGRKMMAFPLHPRYARLLLAAQEFHCVRQAALIAALTQGRDLLQRNVDRDTELFRDSAFGEQATSDFWTLLRAWEYASKSNFRPEACRRAGINFTAARQVAPLLENFLRIAEREGLQVNSTPARDEDLQKCVLTAFSDRVARRLDAGSLRCELVHGRRGQLVRESVVRQSPLLVAAEVRETENKDGSLNTMLSLATAIQVEWLHELFPEDIESVPHVFYDADTRRVHAEEQGRFRSLSIGTRRVEPPPQDAAASLLAEEVLAGRLTLSHWDESVDQWITRLNNLCKWCPDFQLPPITPEDRRALVEQICLGSFSQRDIRDLEVKSAVRSWLSEAQLQLVERHAPERLNLPNGRKPRIHYVADGAPYIAVRIQELYDVTATPRIAQNRVPITIHFLAPSQRPVQITQDLAGFWREHYPRIKQELQRKYPKHEWR